MFWDISNASWKESELKEGNCESDCTHLTGCDSCNVLKLNCCKDWHAETDCVYVIKVLK